MKRGSWIPRRAVWLGVAAAVGLAGGGAPPPGEGACPSSRGPGAAGVADGQRLGAEHPLFAVGRQP